MTTRLLLIHPSHVGYRLSIPITLAREFLPHHWKEIKTKVRASQDGVQRESVYMIICMKLSLKRVGSIRCFAKEIMESKITTWK